MRSTIIPAILRAQKESGLTITPTHLDAVRIEALTQAFDTVALAIDHTKVNHDEDGTLVPGLDKAKALVSSVQAGAAAVEAIDYAMTKGR